MRDIFKPTTNFKLGLSKNNQRTNRGLRHRSVGWQRERQEVGNKMNLEFLRFGANVWLEESVYMRCKNKTMRNYIQCVTHHKPLPNINNIENGNLTENTTKKKRASKNRFDSNRSLIQRTCWRCCILPFFSSVCFAVRLESVYCGICAMCN